MLLTRLMAWQLLAYIAGIDGHVFHGLEHDKTHIKKTSSVAMWVSWRMAMIVPSLQGFAVVYLVGLLQVIPWCRHHGKPGGTWYHCCCCGIPPMVYPGVVGYTKGCRVVHPAWYCRVVVVYGCGSPEQRQCYTAGGSPHLAVFYPCGYTVCRTG